MGNNHVAALKSDRTVWTWGLNSSGQLGNGTTTNQLTPVQVKTNATTFLTNAIDIAASANVTAALLADQTVLCWGMGTNGRLGNGAITNQSYPVAVLKAGGTTKLSNVVAITAGDDFHAALCSDGTVWSWGKGGIGTGSSADQTKATPLLLNSTGLAINGITQIVAGGTHLLMLSGATGAVYAAGSNTVGLNKTSGQLGDNTVVAKTKAVPVLKADLTPLTGIADLAAGQNHSIAIDVLGAVYAWGLNTTSQLGDNTTTQRNTATLIPGLSEVVEAAGGSSHTIFVKTNGEVWVCGANATGQLGQGTTTTSAVPTALTSITNGVKVSARNNSTVIGKSDGTVVGFGENIFGNFGDGTVGYRWSFGAMTGERAVAKISARGSNSAFVKNNGSAWTVGANASSQLSSGLTGDQALVVQAKNATGFLTQITDVAQGLTHTLFLQNGGVSGTVWAAGANTNGQLGDMTLLPKSTAVNVINSLTSVPLTGVTAVAAGDLHSVALTSDGTAWTWGRNNFGQLGNGNTTDQKSAVQLLASAGVPFAGVTAIAAMGNDTILLRGSDQTVWVTGSAGNGQLGNNTTTPNKTYPVQVLTAVGVPLSGITAIAGGSNHGLALKSDGTVWSWGYNGIGQLGDGTITQRTMAVQVKADATTNFTGAAKIFAGGNASGIIDSLGKFWVWGSNSYGGLGDSTLVAKSYPTQIGGLTGALQGAMGSDHTVAIRSNATILSSGLNLKGQLGSGTVGYSLLPVMVPNFRILHGEDADGDGVASFQELLNGIDPDKADTDRDGVLDGADTLPLDFYNGLAPVLTIDNTTNNQSAFPNEVLPKPLIVNVKNAATTPLVNAPVTFTVTLGGGKIGSSVPTTTATTFTVLTDSAGKAQFYWKLGSTSTVTQRATAQAGTSAVLTLTGKFWVDSDGDGLPDTWENAKFGGLTQTATGDYDNDGVKNIDEFKRGTDPKLATSKTLTIYASPAGSDQYNGFTAATPKQTIPGGVGAMQSGDTLQMNSGEYNSVVVQTGNRQLVIRAVGTVSWRGN